MKRATALAGAIALVAAGVTAVLVLQSSSGGGGVVADDLHVQNILDGVHLRGQERGPDIGSHRFGTRNGFGEVGFSSLTGQGFNSDVWVQETAEGDFFAYVGTWGTSGITPNNGAVKVVDVTDPENPTLVNLLPPPPGTRTNDVKVHDMTVGPMAGKQLLFVSNEAIADPGHTGFQVWDVTDPTQATQVGMFTASAGVHNLWPFTRADLGMAFVALAVPADTRGLQIVDVTNPSRPRLVSKFGIGEPIWTGIFAGSDNLNLIHDVTTNPAGTIVYASWWDAGLITVDISNPRLPQMLDRFDYGPPVDQGNTHFAQATTVGSQRIVVVGDEMFAPECPYGFTRLFDATDPTNLTPVGQFDGNANMLDAADGSNDLHIFPEAELSGCLTDADYTMHNAWPIGSDIYISWYSNGIQRIDISDPTDPVQKGYYIHEGMADPQAIDFLPTAPLFWGVAVDSRGLVYGSDINAGLFILEVEPPDSPQPTTFP